MTIVLIPGAAWEYAKGVINPVAVRRFDRGKGVTYAVALSEEEAKYLLVWYKDQIGKITFSERKNGQRASRSQHSSLHRAEVRLRAAIREMTNP